jgi:hypothetical protein
MSSSSLDVISLLNYSPSTNLGEIDFRLEVPAYENSGPKSSSMVVSGVSG